MAPGSMWRTMIRCGRRPEGLRGGDEVRLAQLQELRPHESGRGRPAGERDGEDDDPDVADPEERHDQQHQEQVRQRQDDVDETHQGVVHPAAEVAGEDPDERSDAGDEDDRRRSR